MRPTSSFQCILHDVLHVTVRCDCIVHTGTSLADIFHQHVLQLRFCGAHAAYCRNQLHVVRVTCLTVRIYDDANACFTRWNQPRLPASSSRVILTTVPQSAEIDPHTSSLRLALCHSTKVVFRSQERFFRPCGACCATLDIKVFSLLIRRFPTVPSCACHSFRRIRSHYP